jgi:HAD superfamily hydrolase (TIGR01549 family)
LTRAIEAVVFDVGETLVDETRAYSSWADHLGVPKLTLFAVAGALIARDEQHPSLFELFRPGIDARAEWQRLRAAGEPVLFSAEDLYPDALPAIEGLAAAGYRLGIAGNQPVEATAVLRDLGIELDLIAMSDEWGLAKPDPAFFARIADELGLPPSSIAYVGDRLDNDVRPAGAAGMLAVFIRRGPWGWIQAGRDAPPEADLVLETLTELPQKLEAAGVDPPHSVMPRRSPSVRTGS